MLIASFWRVFLVSAFSGALLVSTASAGTISLPDFTELSATHSPSVVKIGAVREMNAASNKNQLPEQQVPEIFKHFFEGQPDQNSQPRQSSGSGFFVSSDGYILTNNHVIDGADEVTVWLTDRSEFSAKVIGVDPRTDLAVLKVDGNNFTAVEFGDSDALRVGEWVLAIGAPFNLDYSVTAGIVSAMGRNLGENYIPFIQTDVAINPGNSGGPLFNLDGEVVGINAQIYTRSGGYMGVSFSIPSNLAKNVYQQIVKNGKVSRGWLGVLIQQLNQDLAESYGLDRAQGALVSRVLENSPASKAGLQNGDVILKFNGMSIANSSELPPMVGTVLPGNKAEVEILREGKRKILSILIEELPGEKDLAQNSQIKQTESSDNILNVRVESLTAEEKDALNESGVKVISVMDGPAKDAGIISGDIITMVGNRKVDSPKLLKDMLDVQRKGRPFALRVLRNGSPMFIPIRIN